MITRTVFELAEICGATLEGDGGRRVVGPASLEEATHEEISFLANDRYAPHLRATRAAAVLVPEDLVAPTGTAALLRCSSPSRAFTTVIEVFRPRRSSVPTGVHPTAVVAEGAQVAPGASVGALCVVGEGAVLEEGVVLHPRVVVGADCRIGSGSELCPGVVLYPRVEVGRDCLIHGGAVLGADGFGFEPCAEGWEKIPQCGSVLLEDDVEIGANSTIDRGRFGPTRILHGTKIDNLVHVGHNVCVGPEALLVAQVGVSGSARIGRRAILAGQVGVSGHVQVGDGARVTGQSGVGKDLAGGADYTGSPARPRAAQMRSLAALTRLPELTRRVKELEARIEELARAQRAPAGAATPGEGES